MAPPFLFTLRHRGYQVGCAVLLLATIMVIFGVTSPGWYSVHELGGTQYYTHLWIRCSNGLSRCHFLGTSEVEAFQKATQAFALLGLMGLVASCLMAVYFNFLTENKRHHRLVEVAIIVSGGLAFLAGIIFVAGDPNYAAAETADKLKPLKISLGYGLGLTFTGAILAMAAGVVVLIFNKALEIPSDERSLSDLRRTDPVGRLHREARGRGRRGGGDGGGDEDGEGDAEFGFTNPALDMADEEASNPPDEEREEENRRPPSYRNFGPLRPPADVSRPIGLGAGNMNGYPPSMEDAATAGHPANKIDRPHHQPLHYQQHRAPENPHRPVAVDHQATAPASGFHAGRDPHLDLDPGSQLPPRYLGPDFSQRPPEERERRERGRERERGPRDRYPPRSMRPRSEADDDSILREKRNNEINAAVLRRYQHHQQQPSPRPRSEGDNNDPGVGGGRADRGDWQREPRPRFSRSQSQGYYGEPGEERRKTEDDLQQRSVYPDPHHPPNRPHRYGDRGPQNRDGKGPGQQPRSSSLGRVGAGWGSDSHEHPPPSRRRDAAGYNVQNGREEEEDVYADGDLGEPTPNHRQAAVKTWVKGGGNWGRAFTGGEGGEMGREGEARGRGAEGGPARSRPPADDRYVDDVHIYANVSPGYEHRYPSPHAPPPDHPHHQPPPPPTTDHRGQRFGRDADRYERANVSDRNAPDSQNSRSGRANFSDRNDPRVQNARRQNDYGATSGNDTTQADEQGYVNAIRENALHNNARRSYDTERAFNNEKADEDQDTARFNSDYVRVARGSDQALNYAERRYDTEHGRERTADKDRQNFRRKNDYVNVVRDSDQATFRDEAYEGWQRKMQTGRQNSHSDTRQISDQQANALSRNSYSEVGRDDDARALRLSGADDVMETDVDNVTDDIDDSFPRSPPLQSEL